MPSFSMTPSSTILLTASTGDSPAGIDPHTVLKALAQGQARVLLAGTGFAPLVDNSGGLAGSLLAPVLAAAPASSGGVANLASQAPTEAMLSSVRDAVGELFTRANAAAGFLGLPATVSAAGGAAPDGTIDAVNTVVASAATGANIAGYNAAVSGLNGAFYQLSLQVGRLCHATGKARTRFAVAGTPGPVAAINTATGAAGSPGVTVADVAAAGTVFRNNIATLAAELNSIVTKNPLPTVLVQ